MKPGLKRRNTLNISLSCSMNIFIFIENFLTTEYMHEHMMNNEAYW